MTTVEEKKEVQRHVWRRRTFRLATGAHVLVAVALAGLALVLANGLAGRYVLHRNISSRQYYALSDKTRSLLAGLKEPVEAYGFFRRGNDLYDDARNLLLEYEHESERSGRGMFKVTMVDPDRDLARTRELKKTLEVGAANGVVFNCSGRKKYVGARDIMEYQIGFSKAQTIEETLTAFKGEQVFSSAIQSVAQSARPVVYFLTGHGERDITDYGKPAGFSTAARALRRDNVELKVLLLAQQKGVPEDASALVIAGPDRKLSVEEVSLLSKYLDRNGRILFLADPGTTTGLDPLLKRWGVKLGAGMVVGLSLSGTGKDLMIAEYGDHAITRKFRNVATIFCLPRAVEPDAGPADGGAPDAPADKPRLTVLAANTAAGWEEFDFKQDPPRFDPGVDRRGPVPIAVAVEKGPVSGIEVELKPSRMVVIGDSLFAANGFLADGGGANEDLLLSAINWLLERESLMAIAPKPPYELKLDADRKRLQWVFGVMVGGIPGVVAFFGLLVWLKRRS